MKKNKFLAFMSMYLALAICLDFLKEFLPFLNMPYGGSVNIALVPICLASFSLGCKRGAAVGFLWFLLSCLLGLNKWLISIGQIIADYILPSVIMGFSSLFGKKNLFKIEAGIVVCSILRSFSIVFSGAVYWPGSLAGGSLQAWIASCTYNLPYLIATSLMLMVVVPILLKSLRFFDKINL